jgi:hypothetical protein
MSQLSPFVRAFRSLSVSFAKQAELALAESRTLENDSEQRAAADRKDLLDAIGDAFQFAATDLEQQIARDLGRTGRQFPEGAVASDAFDEAEG